MNKLLADRSFARKTAERYFSLRETTLSEAFIYGYIDSVATVLGAAQKRHYTKWPILGQNVGAPEVDAQPTTYAGEVSKFKNWIGTRLRWLDMNIGEFIVTATEETTPVNANTVFPNPASWSVNISSTIELGQVQVISPQGNMMVSQKVHDQKLVTLPISHLSAGLYLLKLTFTDGSRKTEKLVVQ